MRFVTSERTQATSSSKEADGGEEPVQLGRRGQWTVKPADWREVMKGW